MVSIADFRYQAIYLFAFLLMLRIDEVINLDFECIDFKEGGE